MPLWTLTPTAEPGDPRWANSPIWSRVIVSAPTSGQARAVAAAMEARKMDYDPRGSQVGTQAMSHPSAFLDPKLYAAQRSGETEAEAGVLEALEFGRGASADAVPG